MVYCWYTSVGVVVVPLVVQVVPSGEVCMANECDVVLLFLLYQNEKIPGLLINGVRIASLAALKTMLLLPVLGKVVPKVIEVSAQVPPDDGIEEPLKLSYT